MPTVTGKIEVELRQTSPGPPPVRTRFVTIRPRRTGEDAVEFEALADDLWGLFVGNGGGTATVTYTLGPPAAITSAKVW